MLARAAWNVRGALPVATTGAADDLARYIRRFVELVVGERRDMRLRFKPPARLHVKDSNNWR
jgi:hypothetical protein